MRILSEGEDVWVVELNKQEMEMIAPNPQEEWYWSFYSHLKEMNLPSREHNALRRGFGKNPDAGEFIRCFKKQGVLLTFEEWAAQPDLQARLEQLTGVGKFMAKDIARKIEEYLNTKE